MTFPVHLPPRTFTASIVARRSLSHDVLGLWLELPRGERLDYLPGQYVDFLLPDGRRRSFSIAGDDAAARTLEFHLRVTPDGRFARQVRDEMPDRAEFTFEGPLGSFYLREHASRPALLVAGGTGFAPIKAMLEKALTEGTRPLHLFWGVRQRRDLYLDALAREWAAEHRNLRYTPVLSDPDPGWGGAEGLVHEAALSAFADMTACEAYLAGPPAMVHAARRDFSVAGLDPARLFHDAFDYAYETWPSLG